MPRLIAAPANEIAKYGRRPTWSMVSAQISVPSRAGRLRDQAVAQRHVERQLEHGAEDRRQPDHQAVVDEIGREPDHPDHQRAPQIGRPEQVGQRRALVARRDHRLQRRQRLPGRFLASRARSSTARHRPRRCGRAPRASAAIPAAARAGPARGSPAARRCRTSIASRDSAPPRPRWCSPPTRPIGNTSS